MEERNNALKNVGFGVAYAPVAALDLVSETLMIGGNLASGIVKVVDGVVSLPSKVLYGMGKGIGGPAGGVLSLTGGILAIPSAALKVANLGLLLGTSLLFSLPKWIAMPIKQLAYKIKGINYLEERKKYFEAYAEAKIDALEEGFHLSRYEFIKTYIQTNGLMGELLDKTMEAVEIFKESNAEKYEARVREYVGQHIQEMKKAGKEDQVNEEEAELAIKLMLELPKLVRYVTKEHVDFDEVVKGKSSGALGFVMGQDPEDVGSFKFDVISLIKKYIDEYAERTQMTERETEEMKKLVKGKDKTIKFIATATFITYASKYEYMDFGDPFVANFNW